MNVLMKLYDGCAITVSGSCMRVMPRKAKKISL